MNTPTMAELLIPIIVSFLTALVIAPVLIPFLHKLKFGQQILEDGPVWHKKKSGTPTMGGFIFIGGVLVFSIINLAVDFDMHYLLLLAASLGFGAIGFIDDYVKVIKKRNLGLTAAQKLLLQALVTVAYVYAMYKTGSLDSEIILPFTSVTLTMPWWLYIPLILIAVTGTVNAVNLTDGLDGLAASVTIVVAGFFGLMSSLFGSFQTTYFAHALVGGLFGFLIFNKYPARVFMGDTGSLFLGGAVSVMAVSLKMPLILIIAGLVYLIEALSVILQVLSFKLTGKRIFKMAPIHHHFEMSGWSERKIVLVFTLAAIAMCALAYFSVIPALRLV